MQPIDLLLLAALVALSTALALAFGPIAGLVTFSAGCVALWFLLGDE